MASPGFQAIAPVDNDPVKDVSLNTFMAEVIEASRQQPVIVDFWATWCGPCKQLTPILEKLVRASKGAVRLAKIDIDRNPEIAQQMGVQSVPAVFAFFDGRPIDGFMGALPEVQVKAWIEKLIKTTGAAAPPSEEDNIDLALAQANDFVAAGDSVAAQSIYMDVLDRDAVNVLAYVGVLRCMMARNEVDAAREMLAQAPSSIVKDKAFEPIRTALELAAQAQESGSLTDLLAATEKDPLNHQARYDLAMAYYAAGKKEEAVESLLEIVKRNRTWNEDAARKQLVKFFEAFGFMDPLSISGRKRLSSILFA